METLVDNVRGDRVALSPRPYGKVEAPHRMSEVVVGLPLVAGRSGEVAAARGKRRGRGVAVDGWRWGVADGVPAQKSHFVLPILATDGKCMGSSTLHHNPIRLHAITPAPRPYPRM